MKKYMAGHMGWILFSFSSLCLAKASPSDIVKKADNIRNPNKAFEMKVEVVSTTQKSPSVFDVFTKGNNQTLIRTLEPSRDKGRDLLMVDENMWAYVPNLKRAVRVGLSQKLTGEAANGDISRMRWADDYSATLEKENKSEWTLLLVAKKKGLTYEKIRAKISKKDYRPLSAEYLTKSNKVLKTAQFEGYKNLAGAERPSKIVIRDAVRKNNQSVITIQSMKVKSLPNTLFSKDKFQSK